MLFKINGERNSGTNFLKLILIQNGFPTYTDEITNDIVYHWKHGIPRNDVKQKSEKVIDIFIFRNLEQWLPSMYMNPYHLEKINNFHDFLVKKQTSDETKLLDDKTNRILNEDDNGKTIFEIRYYKFKKIMEYRKNNKFVLFVHLSFLQNENNLLYFLHYLNTTYMNNSLGNFITKIPHTKDSTINKNNRDYGIDIHLYQDIIDKKKDVEIEEFINNLTFIDTSSP
jgi:hypothetical protein